LSYRVEIADAAFGALKGIPDKRIQQEILNRIARLKEDPDKQGKALVGDLSGYRSVRVAAQRYRIIYRIQDDQIVVVVVMLGIRKEGDRKDVYALARKLINAGLLD
jgi:mRNA interferase RelE/StbE